MNATWVLARQGAQKFGGSMKLYFATSLRLIWQEHQSRSVWRKGVGNQIWMPGVPLVEQSKQGQAILPGLLLK